MRTGRGEREMVAQKNGNEKGGERETKQGEARKRQRAEILRAGGGSARQTIYVPRSPSTNNLRPEEKRERGWNTVGDVSHRLIEHSTHTHIYILSHILIVSYHTKQVNSYRRRGWCSCDEGGRRLREFCNFATIFYKEYATRLRKQRR